MGECFAGSCKAIVLEYLVVHGALWVKAPQVVEEMRGKGVLSDELIYIECVWHYIVNYHPATAMLKPVCILLALLALTSAYPNCRDCKEPVHVASCPDYHCYRCGPNE